MEISKKILLFWNVFSVNVLFHRRNVGEGEEELGHDRQSCVLDLIYS